MVTSAPAPRTSPDGMVATAPSGLQGDLELWTWPLLAGVDAYVTSTSGGVSTGRFATLDLGLHVGDDPGLVRENRRRLATALNARLEDFVFCEQAHLPTVAVVGTEHRGRGTLDQADALPATDALVTTTPGIVLVVMVADCVPLVLHDPVTGVLAVVHAGWRGTVAGVTREAVRVMVGLGAQPADIRAGIGPAISAEVYQVGDEVRAAAAVEFGDRVDEVVRPDGTGAWLFDLVSANTAQLLEAGLERSHIAVSGLVTGPGTPFYSHRLAGPCGRFAAVARLTASSTS